MHISFNESLFYSRQRADWFVTIIATLLIVALLTSPIYILWVISVTRYTNENAIAFGVLLVFTLIVVAIMSLFIKAKRYEILGAAFAWVKILLT